MSLTWDDNGQLTDWGTTDYAWTALGQLSQTAVSGETARDNTYDALGRRVSTKVSSAETQFLYHGWHMIGEYDQTNSKWLWQEVPMNRGEGMLEHVALDTNDIDTDSNTTEYRQYAVHEDWQSSVWSLSDTSDTSGAIVERYEQDDPFGASHTLDSSDTNIGNYASNVYHLKRMHGGVTEKVSGLYDFRNRWLSAASGSWLSRDPLGQVDSQNLYQYVWGNNLVNTDPNGLYGTPDFPCPGKCFTNYDMASLQAKCEGLPDDSPCKEACDALKAAMKSCGKSARKLQACVNEAVEKEWEDTGGGNRWASTLGAGIASAVLGRGISPKVVLRGGAIVMCKAKLGGRDGAGPKENGAVGSAYDIARIGACSAAGRVATCVGELPAHTIR